ncbi:hypothetical protein NLI96_g2221 [Meripilus lineatus]|uniref:Uncharacterized protein n=1 Tax=Meripilus lineatus TaxID=2056292 RepID=A0AAD5VEH5_9APHY|nr:hypothetical protein NLI96_g2221 [Physisporinus lineatus]
MDPQVRDARRPGRKPSITQTWNKSLRSQRVVALVVFNLLFNGAILYATFHTFTFGALITNETSWITDNRLLPLIEFTAKLPAASTAFVGGLAASQLWSKKLLNARSGAGIAELQSLNAFSSSLTIPRVLLYLIEGRYILARKLYTLIAFAAILLQFYSTAIVTLITPSLTFVPSTLTTYQFTELPFMTEPVDGYRCLQSYDSDNEVKSCLQLMLVGSALVDIDNYNGSWTWSGDESYPLWTEVDIIYSGGFIGGAVPVGPLNGVDLTNGALTVGLNIATIERLLDMDRIWGSAETQINVGTTAPLLTCRCEKVPRSSDNISTVAIGADTYDIEEPIPLLQDGQAVGQVTSNNLTLLLSFGNELPNSTTHCAIDLMLAPANITIYYSTLPHGILSSVVAYPSLDPWEFGNLTDFIRAGASPMRNFSDYWLGGIGWSPSPSRSAVASFLAGLPIGMETSTALATNGSFLEYYVLTMLASGISMAFPPENSPTNSSLPSARSYQVWTRQYFIGLRTHFQRFLTFVVFFDCAFVICCLVIILRDGWYPDWTDPATLMCVPLIPLGDGLRSQEVKHLVDQFEAKGLWKWTDQSLRFTPKLWKARFYLRKDIISEFVATSPNTSEVEIKGGQDITSTSGNYLLFVEGQGDRTITEDDRDSEVLTF